MLPSTTGRPAVSTRGTVRRPCHNPALCQVLIRKREIKTLTKEIIMRKCVFAVGGVLCLGLIFTSEQLIGGKGDPPPKGGAAANGPAAKAIEPATARSRIVKVTVYPGNALVTREVEVPPGNGLTELVVADLPVRTMQSSLYSESANGMRVLSTRFRTRPVEEDTREEVRKLEDERRKLLISSQKITADLEVIVQNMQMLTKLEKFTETTAAHTTEKGGVNGDAAITMAKYVMEQRADKAKEKVALQQQLDTLKEQAVFLQRKFDNLTAGATRVERDAIIIVDRENGAGGTVRLNYLVDRAGWQPQYKLRASAKGKDPVQIDYLAGVSQQSGEDWGQVEVTLSTAQPMLNAAPPELAKLEVAVVARASVPMPPGGGGGSGPTFAPQPEGALTQKALGLRAQAGENYRSNKDAGLAGRQLNEAAAYEQA